MHSIKVNLEQLKSLVKNLKSESNKTVAVGVRDMRSESKSFRKEFCFFVIHCLGPKYAMFSCLYLCKKQPIITTKTVIKVRKTALLLTVRIYS